MTSNKLVSIMHFTHGDLDGVACALLARRCYTNISTTMCNYSGRDSIDNLVTKYLNSLEREPDAKPALLITDICPSKSVCDRIDDMRDRFSWILVQDHHGTTAWMSKYDWAEHDDENARCGVVMLADHLSYKHDDFIEAVDAHDRWQVSSPHFASGQRFNMLYKFLGFKRFRYPLRHNRFDDTTDRLIEILEEKLRKDIDATLSSMPNVLEDVNGLKYAVIYPTSSYTSEMAHAILNKRPDIDYLVLVLPHFNTVSLRSRRGIDVSKLAAIFGGGGHPQAAGFSYPLKRLTLTDFMTDEIIEKFKTLNMKSDD